GIATRLEVITELERIDEAVLDYAKLENVGWKAAGGTAIAPGNAQHRFYSEMLQRFGARNEARIYRYFFGDRLVATDLCLHSREALIILKTTYAESEKTSSPALLMREEAFAKLFADGRTTRIEFYGKVMEWHTKWSDEIRTLFHINHYRFGWLRRIHALNPARQA
ncbi:MAG: GNAT family N-acetyltransferase, partial [Burkholderiales bacterium]